MKLIKIKDDHYVIVDDSEIKDGDWMIRKGEQPILVTPNFWWDFGVPYKKITHSTRPFGGSATAISLFEVKQLIGEGDVEKKVKEYYEKNTILNNPSSFKAGYNQALEDNKDKKYTESDLHNLLRARRQLYSHTDVNVVRDFIQSLQPKTEWEVEIVDNKINIK